MGQLKNTKQPSDPPLFSLCPTPHHHPLSPKPSPWVRQVNNSSLWKRATAWERSRAASAYGIIWWGRSSRPSWIMPKHKSCCVPLCTNNFRNSTRMTFYRIPKKESIRREYVRLLRNDSFKLEPGITRVCYAHWTGGKKLSRDHLPSIFPWSKKKTKRRILSRVLPNNPVSACGATSFPGYHSFPKWAVSHLEQAKYVCKPYTLVSRIAKKSLQPIDRRKELKFAYLSPSAITRSTLHVFTS